MAVPSLPTISVQIAFATDPFSAPTWVEVGLYFQSIQYRGGRTDEFSEIQAATFTVRLRNTDRRFDPENAAGPYYPNLVPMRRIRWRVTYNAVTYALYSGFIDSWDQEWQGPHDACAVIASTDGFGFLAGTVLLPAVYSSTVLADRPTAYYRLDELAGVLASDASGNAYAGYYIGTVLFGQPGAALAETGTAIGTASPVAGVMSASGGVSSLASIAGTGDFTIEAWVELTRPVASNLSLYKQRAPSSGLGIALYFLGSGGIFPNLLVQSVRGGSTTLTSTVGVPKDGRLHHVVATRRGATLAIYVDAVSGGTRSTGLVYDIPVATHSIWGLNESGLGLLLPSLYGELDEVALYPSALSAARILAHYVAAAEFGLNETTGTRMGSILNIQLWPAADRAIDTGRTTAALITESLASTTTLSYLQDLNRAERGVLYMDGTSKVTFLDRTRLLSPPYTVSQATFGDGAGELPYKLGGVVASQDKKFVSNKAVANRVGGAIQLASDAASVTRYTERVFPRAELTDLLIGGAAADAEVLDRCNYEVGQYKSPATRFPTMTVNPQRLPATLYPQVLGRRFKDLITVKRRPPGGGAVISKGQRIEGISHSVTPNSWVTQWDIAPADTLLYWVLGVAALDTGTRLGY